jgi:3-isopropylmalate/(R)-2-methylmalate dehydratase large subunit
MGLTATEKIIGRALGKLVQAGDIVYPEPDLVTVHDYYVTHFARALDELGVERLFAAEKVLVSTDHEPLAVTPEGAERQKQIREIVERYGISMFFDAGRGGLGHVFPMEMGYVVPGMFVLGYDTHVTNYGAVGALGIAVVVEISEVLACGSVWLRVPETVRVTLTGELQPGVAVRDAAQKLISVLGADLVDYTVVEFTGPALSGIGLDGRVTLCNTPCDIGAKSTIVEPDTEILEYVSRRAQREYHVVKSDPDADFKAQITFDLSGIEPQVAAPTFPDNVVSITEVTGLPIHHAFIGSCASGMLDDLRVAASILRNGKVHSGVRLFITPATQRIAAQAAAEGLLRIFAEAGAIVTAPGCGPCAAGRIAPTASGEVSINTGTRNDRGRLGSDEAEIYLASPATVAASAVVGSIADPRELV